jgi:CRISPR type IV-associated protein Csf3
MKHTCELIYEIGAKSKVYGSEKGICRITGKESIGLPFDKWVRDTFNDHDFLYPGTIISNEALFCFDESSEIIQKKTGRDKPQRFRTYSHIIKNGEWYCVGWPDKIAELLQFCTNIGKNSGDGWGEVLRWEIKEWPEDWSVRGAGNILMRNVPLKQDGKGIMYGMRPSYWNSRHIAVCKMP